MISLVYCHESFQSLIQRKSTQAEAGRFCEWGKQKWEYRETKVPTVLKAVYWEEKSSTEKELQIPAGIPLKVLIYILNYAFMWEK